jgi:hypothetical protein
MNNDFKKVARALVVSENCILAANNRARRLLPPAGIGGLDSAMA